MTALGPARLRADQSPAARLRAARARLNRIDSRANTALKALCLIACVLVFLVMVALVYQVIKDSRPAVAKFGIGLFFHTGWIPQENVFGVLPLIYGTLVTSLVSLVFATVLGVSIGIFLAMIAPRRVAAVLGPMVEMLAAVPSVVYGMIGLIVVAPFLSRHIEAALHSVLGWTGLFGTPQLVGNSLFTACLVLTFMVLPIIAALCRDIFLTVPE
jgi:phosphate transport system permease protein